MLKIIFCDDPDALVVSDFRAEFIAKTCVESYKASPTPECIIKVGTELLLYCFIRHFMLGEIAKEDIEVYFNQYKIELDNEVVFKSPIKNELDISIFGELPQTIKVSGFSLK